MAKKENPSSFRLTAEALTQLDFISTYKGMSKGDVLCELIEKSSNDPDSLKHHFKEIRNKILGEIGLIETNISMEDDVFIVDESDRSLLVLYRSIIELLKTHEYFK